MRLAAHTELKSVHGMSMPSNFDVKGQRAWGRGYAFSTIMKFTTSGRNISVKKN